jgi:hypothetical protein
MPPQNAVQTGGRLDQDHPPETNGRMAICRRCGSRTDDAAGSHHVPADGQITRIQDWLAAESKRSDIKRALEARGR